MAVVARYVPLSERLRDGARKRWVPALIVLTLIASACNDVDSFDRPDGPLDGSRTETLERPWFTDGLAPEWLIQDGIVGFAESANPAKTRRAYVQNGSPSIAVEWDWASEGPDAWSSSGVVHTKPGGTVDSGLRVIYSGHHGGFALLEDGEAISGWAPSAPPVSSSTGRIEVRAEMARFLLDGHEVIGWTEWSHSETNSHGLVTDDAGEPGATLPRFSEFRIERLPEGDAPQFGLLRPEPGEAVFGVEDIEIGVPETLDVLRVSLVAPDDVVDASQESNVVWSAEWDTRSLPDGEHELHVEVELADGNVLATPPQTVIVTNGVPPLGRIDIDFERGLLDADEWAVLAVVGSVAPAALAGRYEATDSTAPSTVGIAVTLARAHEVASPDAVLALSAFLAGSDNPVDVPNMVPAGAQERWATCSESHLTRTNQQDFEVLVPIVGRQRIASQGLGAEWCTYREGEFEIRYRPRTATPDYEGEPLDPAGFDPAGVDAYASEWDPFAPARVLQVMAELQHANAVYEELGFGPLTRVSAGNPLVVYLHGHDNFALPVGQGIRPVVNLAGQRSDVLYFARHELFHIFQYDHMTAWGLPALGYITSLMDQSTALWMEATAQWAAARASLGREQAGHELDRLPYFLGNPANDLFSLGEPLFRFGDPPPPRVYGSWILAEYLEARHIGGVLESWRKIDLETNAKDAIEQLAIDSGGDLPGFVRGFWVASYLLAHQTPSGLVPGFQPTAPLDTWRAQLGGQGTGSDSFAPEHRAGRVAESVVLEEEGTPEDFELTIGSGGAAILDVRPRRGIKGTLRFRVETVAPQHYLVTVLGFDAESGYPTVCAKGGLPHAYWQPTIIEGAIEGSLELDEDCDAASLIITRHAFDDEIRDGIEPGVLPSDLARAELTLWLDEAKPARPDGVDSEIALDGPPSGGLALGSTTYVRSDPIVGGGSHNVCVRIRAFRSGGLFPSAVDIYVTNAATGELMHSALGITTMFTGSSGSWTFGPFWLDPWEAALVRVEVAIPQVNHWTAEAWSVAAGQTAC